jgi:hypothetical protein
MTVKEMGLVIVRAHQPFIFYYNFDKVFGGSKNAKYTS